MRGMVPPVCAPQGAIRARLPRPNGTARPGPLPLLTREAWRLFPWPVNYCSDRGLKSPLHAQHKEIAVRQGLAVGCADEGGESQIRLPDRQIGHGNSDFVISRPSILRVI